MSQEFHLSNLKFKFSKLGIQLMVSKNLQNDTQMILMLLLKRGVDQNVVNEDYSKLIQIRLEYPMHEIHECCWHIRQFERHHCELEMPVPHPEHCLKDISFPNSQLMITGTEIYLGVDLCPSQSIK